MRAARTALVVAPSPLAGEGMKHFSSTMGEGASSSKATCEETPSPIAIR